MKIVVHIGPPKTGSTSIQEALASAKDDLLRNGIFYHEKKPLRIMALSTLFLPKDRNPSGKLVRLTGSIEKAYAWSEANWQDFEAEVDKLQPALTIISSERFPLIEDVDAFIGRLAKRFDDIYVIAYVRDPVGSFVSEIQERIRGGAWLGKLPTPNTFPYKGKKVLKRYMRAVGKDRMIVRNFASNALMDGDVVADFAVSVSALGTPFALTSIRSRDAIPASAVAWLLTFNEASRGNHALEGQGGIVHERNTFLRERAVKRFLAIPDVETLPRLKLQDPDMRDAIWAKTREDCLWINQTFLADQVPLVIPDAAPDGSKRTREEEFGLMRDWILGHLEDPSMVEAMKSQIITKPWRKPGEKWRGHGVIAKAKRVARYTRSRT